MICSAHFESNEVLEKYVLQPGLSRGDQIEWYEQIRLLVHDAPCDLPASSVEAGVFRNSSTVVQYCHTP